jgi:prolipoprotein diacylglyceryltransferase
MMFDSGFLWWPFAAAGFGLMLILGILVLIFWIWMIVDAAKRNFREDWEKVVWIVVIVFGGWLGALVYFIVVRQYNPKGLAKK